MPDDVGYAAAVRRGRLFIGAADIEEELEKLRGRPLTAAEAAGVLWAARKKVRQLEAEEKAEAAAKAALTFKAPPRLTTLREDLKARPVSTLLLLLVIYWFLGGPLLLPLKGFSEPWVWYTRANAPEDTTSYR